MATGLKITEFYHWWVSELLDMLPRTKGISLNHASDMQIYIDRKSCRLDFSDQDTSIELNEKFTSQLVLEKYHPAIIGMKKHPDSCNLYISDYLLLKRTITLPLATEENIQDVVSYEIDRYTPFKKEDIYYDVKIQNRDKGENKLTVLVTVIKKDIFTEVLNFCDQSGARLIKVFAQDDKNGHSNELSFIGLQNSGTAKTGKITTNKFLLVSCVVLLLASLCIPLAKNYWLALQYQNKIQQMSPQISEVSELRSEYQTIRKRVDQANNLNVNSVKLIELLDELTRLVPDDTSLSRFSLEDNVIRIQGTSQSASKLIAILDSSEEFSEVDFAAPVTKSSDEDRENFTVQIKLNTTNNDVRVK